MWKKAIIASAVIGLSACAFDARDYVANKNNNLTVAKAQSQIHKGMSGDQVVSIMGSPNIVTNGEGGTETWVYDKISTENVVAEGNGLYLFGMGAASSQTQKTLTVIVKFNAMKQVDNVAYHQSSF